MLSVCTLASHVVAMTDKAETILQVHLHALIDKFIKMDGTLKNSNAHTARVKKVIEMEGTLSDVKRTVNDLVRKRKLRQFEAGGIIKNWKNRERRRVDRQVKKQTNKACFHCREPGHMLADCPNKGEDETGGGGICYKCGSTEHAIYSCRRKNIKGFPFAICFVCNQEGHLSKDCGKNANGIYPDGGSCNVCNSTKHLRRDCPEFATQKQQKEKNIVAHTMSTMSTADDDYDPNEETKKVKLRNKQKIVKF